MTDDRRQDISIDLGIFAGDDQVVDFFVTTGAPIEVDEAAAVGATSITVKPLQEPIAAGAHVRWGQLIAVLAANAQVGATTLSVTTLSGSLYQGQIGRKAQDVTGFTFEFTAALPPSSTVLLTKALEIQDEDNGVARLTLTDEDTGTTLSGREYSYRARRTDDGYESTIAYGALTLLRF